MKKQFKWIWYALWLLIALVGGGCTLFSWMPRTPGMFYGGCAMLIASAMLGIWMLLLANGKEFKKVWLPSVIAGAIYGGIMALIVYLCDVVIFADSITDYQPVHSSLIVTVLSVVLTVALIVAMPKKYDPKLVWLKRIIALILACVALALGGLPQNYWWGVYKIEKARNQRISTPIGFSNWTKPVFGLAEDADFYVAVDGNDSNDGSFEKPFATIERAKEAVRGLDKAGRTGITVAVKAGEYHISNLTFTAEDSGTQTCPITYCAYGDGEVILNAGITLNPADFEKVTDEKILSRLSESAKNQIICIDLGKQGITLSDYGVMHALGEYTTDEKYDGYTAGNNAELFVNDYRQSLARYPNEGWLYTGAVVEEGEPQESNSNPHYVVPGWADLRNPKGDTYALDIELAQRISHWESLEDVWVWGHFSTDWCFETSPIGAVDFEDLTIYNKFVARYGAEENATYYFYNVLEELDAAGEWYLDRDNGILYMYEPDNLAMAEIMLTLSEKTAIVADDAQWLTLRGFTVQGTRVDAISMTGDHLTVEYCLIHNIGGGGIYIDGYNNLVSNNEITRTGSYGVEMHGGDEYTLDAGNSRVYNNLIHDWGEASGSHGIRLRGVGNLADHNELYNYADVAINHRGNNHIIEYNLIHDVSLQSSDASAIYTGPGTANTWSHVGTIVRYNAVYNMGEPGFSYPNGIYLDDAVMGQTVYGNLLVNIPDNGILVGGGRDNHIWGNVVINTGNAGISYDQRTFDSDFYHMEGLWENLLNSPWQTDAWKTAYPYLQGMHFEEADSDDPMYAKNPANSTVNGNLFVNWQGELGNIAEKPAQYSDFSGNAVYTLDMLEKLFVDPTNGDYRLREDSVVYELIPDFEELPIDKMGRE